MTNADRIRQMTDEEFAAEFPDEICNRISGVECREFDLPCYECRVAWLKQEVKQDDAN